MKAQSLSLILHFSASFDPADATATARRFVAAMPPVDGVASEPWLDADAERLQRPRAEDFESGLRGLLLRNRAVGGEGWGGALDFLHRAGLGVIFLPRAWRDLAGPVRELATRQT